MSRTWFIARNRQRLGPLSAEQIQLLANLGLVQPTEYVLPAGSTQWVMARSARGPLAAPLRPKNYWVAVAGTPVGPFSGDQVREGLHCRRFTGETLVRPEGESDWTAIARMAEFRECLGTAGRDSRAQLGEASRHHQLTEEEAELHLAGKQGDAMACLLSNLLTLRRRYAANPPMIKLIDKNVDDLRAIRAAKNRRSLEG